MNPHRFRVYFNTKTEAPLVWSVDLGDQSTETTVKGFYLYTPVESRFIEPENRKLTPAGWLEGVGFVWISPEQEAYIVGVQQFAGFLNKGYKLLEAPCES